LNDLIAAATAIRERAYAPYSSFPVGAALRGSDGGIHVGCNVENAAFPQGQCAEASAIGAMISAGERRIVEVAVVGGGEALCTPCGGCRQRLAEFGRPDTPVHLCGSEGLRRTVTLGDLLPLAFAAESLMAPAPATPSSSWCEALATLAPRVAIVLGSGLGTLAESVETAATVPYSEIPGFPRPGVAGHAGEMILGRLRGVAVLVLRGRVHLYEGGPPSAVLHWIEALRQLGIRTLLLTNASGSLRPEIGPGSLVVIEDHINLQGTSPLVGSTTGPHFIDFATAYDPDLRAILHAAAKRTGLTLASGVYLAVLGPSFETPAEIRAFARLGADLVGMSTVPEVLAARALGLKVAAVSIVTNLAAGMAPEPLSHAQTLAAATQASADLTRLVAAALPGIADASP
jgi:purine nucleotide phosphorylase/homotetrameric cytidine deaminase